VNPTSFSQRIFRWDRCCMSQIKQNKQVPDKQTDGSFLPQSQGQLKRIFNRNQAGAQVPLKAKWVL
jgi:hypothetical protein